ncbi:MAG TPA: SCO family protein [Blastocatellia bacterium]|nr:SCO family protein [Blastocatellia bacterium]
MKSKGGAGLILIVLLVSSFSGCQEHPRVYPLKGRVVAVAANRQSITIAHEAIPGYMEAMTMPFPVKEPALLDGITPGDEVEGEITVTSSEGWISRLRVTKKGEGRPLPDRSRPLPIEYLVQPGNDVPDVRLIDQNGREFRLSDLSGKIVALTFIFTRCPFPNFCPLMSQRFVEAQKLLDQRSPSLSKRTQFLTVSFDPDYDTPDVLRAYGERWKADFSRWTFATSSIREIAEFGASLGLSFWTEGGLINHNLATAIIRPNGKLQNVLRGNEWKAEELVNEIIAADQ